MLLIYYRSGNSSHVKGARVWHFSKNSNSTALSTPTHCIRLEYGYKSKDYSCLGIIQSQKRAQLSNTIKYKISWRLFSRILCLAAFQKIESSRFLSKVEPYDHENFIITHAWQNVLFRASITLSVTRTVIYLIAPQNWANAKGNQLPLSYGSVFKKKEAVFIPRNGSSAFENRSGQMVTVNVSYNYFLQRTHIFLLLRRKYFVKHWATFDVHFIVFWSLL